MRVWHCVILTIFTTQTISGSNHKLWYSLHGFPDNAGGIIPAVPKTVYGTYLRFFFVFTIARVQKISLKIVETLGVL